MKSPAANSLKPRTFLRNTRALLGSFLIAHHALAALAAAAPMDATTLADFGFRPEQQARTQTLLDNGTLELRRILTGPASGYRHMGWPVATRLPASDAVPARTVVLFRNLLNHSGYQIFNPDGSWQYPDNARRVVWSDDNFATPALPDHVLTAPPALGVYPADDIPALGKYDYSGMHAISWAHTGTTAPETIAGIGGGTARLVAVTAKWNAKATDGLTAGQLSRVYLSDDRGVTWREQPNALATLPAAAVHSGPNMVRHPEFGLVIPFGQETGNAANKQNFLAASADAGETWQLRTWTNTTAARNVEPAIATWGPGHMVIIGRDYNPAYGYDAASGKYYYAQNVYKHTPGAKFSAVTFATARTNIAGNGKTPLLTKDAANAAHDTPEVIYNPVTGRIEVIQSSRWGNGAENPLPADPADPAQCNNSLNIWSIDPVDLLAGGTTWRFDGNLVERRGIILGGAQVGADLDYYKDGYHPGGSIVDEAAGQQHIFIYIGVYTQYANAYRLSRPLDTYAFRAACGLPALPTPAITGVSISGKTITIAGINFTALKEVLIDGKSAAIVSSNITEINATLPDGVTTATADEVTVRTNHGITTGLSDLTQLPPAVSAIRYDAIWPGKPVTITGVNLDDVTKIFFGDIEVTTFISKTDTEIVVAAPEGVTDGVLSLQAAGGDTVPLPISGEYTASVKPYDLAPLVDTQPVVAGYHPLDLVASATGTPSPTYKWQYRNGGTGDWTDVGMSLDYEGVSTAHLTIVNTTGRNGWQYRYVAMNHTEDVYSNPVTLQLLAETFIAPAGIVAASDSDAPDLYIADAHAIYVVTQSNQKALVFAGQSDESGNSDGASDIARFNAPRGLTLDATGRLIVADTGNSRIRAIAPDGAVSTISASHVFDGPRDVVAHNTNGDIYVADTGNHLIKKIDSTGAVYIIAGGGVAGFSDGVGPEVLFNTPSGIAIDNDGDLYVADTGNHAIRHIDMVTGSVSLFAGGTTPGTTDGAVASARFDSPESVAVDNITGRIYVADTGKHRIRVIHSGSVLSIAGQYPGTAGFKDDTMSDTLTVNNGWLASPSAITAGGTRTFYIADTGNTVIRRYRGVTTGEIITLPIEALPADSGTSGGNNGDGGNSGGGGGGGAPSWLFAAALAALLAPRVLINKSRQ